MRGYVKTGIIDLNSNPALIASDVLSSRDISASVHKTLTLSQRERGLKPKRFYPQPPWQKHSLALFPVRPVSPVVTFGFKIMATNMKFSQLLKWQREIVRFFLSYVKPERGKLVFIAMLTLVMTAANALLIWKVGGAITLITQGQFAQLNTTLLIIAAIVLFNQSIQFTQAYTMQRVTLRFVDRVRGKFLEHLMLLSFPVSNKFAKGDLLTRLTSDVDRLLPYVINAPLNLFSSAVLLTVYGSILFWVDWQLALIVAAMAPLFYLSQHYVAPKTGKASRHFIQENANLVAVEEQTLSNLKGISSFGSEQLIRDKHKIQFDTARSWALKARTISISYNAFFAILMYFVGIVIIYSGVSGIQSGTLTIGVLISFLMYVRFLAAPMRTLALIPIQLQANRAAADRIMEIMNMRPAVEDVNKDTSIKIDEGKIAFSNVSFSYPGSSNAVFKDITLNIQAGECVALVGPSGAGKSTLASLLLRFYDPQQGIVTIDGTDIKNVSLASLRRQISIVWQEPLIINGTIKENLLLSRPQANDEQLMAACESAHAREFIAKLEAGMETVIGTKGVNLSVGQKQRLAIAQAFVRDTPILVLDEASSALDSHSEQMIVDAIQSLRQNRTTLIIAHRFSSIRNADRILYFNRDGAISSGTHEELMVTITDYKEAVNWQTTRSGRE